MACRNRVKKAFSTYVEPKHQSDEHNQAGANAFQHLLWIFWVCQLSLMCGIMLTVLSYCLYLITINFNLCI